MNSITSSPHLAGNNPNYNWEVRNNAGNWIAYKCAKEAIAALIKKRKGETDSLISRNPRASVESIESSFEQWQKNMHSTSARATVLKLVAFDPDFRERTLLEPSFPLDAPASDVPQMNNYGDESPSLECGRCWKVEFTPFRWTCHCLALISLLAAAVTFVYFKADFSQMREFLSLHRYIEITCVVCCVLSVAVEVVR